MAWRSYKKQTAEENPKAKIAKKKKTEAKGTDLRCDSAKPSHL